jgi:hypothetical protein
MEGNSGRDSTVGGGGRCNQESGVRKREIRKSNIEIRRKRGSEWRKRKEKEEQLFPGFPIFGFVSSFDIRISNFLSGVSS